MVRRVLWGVVIALVIAAPFAWRAWRHYEVVRLVERPPDVTIRAEEWRVFYDRLMESGLVRRLRASDAFAEVMDSPAGRDFTDLRNGFEVVLDEDPAQLFLRTFGHRIDGGIWRRPSGGFAMGLVSVPGPDTDLADVAARIDVMAKSSPQEPSYQKEGLTIFPLGDDGVLVFGERVAVMASAEALGIALERSWGDRVLAQAPAETGIHVRVESSLYGGDFQAPELEDALQAFGARIATGGLTQALERASTLAIDVVPVSDGISARARLDVGREALGEGGGGWVPALPAETPLGADEVLRVELSRDLARFWAEREAHLSPRALQQLEEREAELGMPGLARQLCEGLAPTLTLQVVNEGAERGLAPVPAVAVRAGLLDPALAGRLERVLELGVERANLAAEDGTRIRLGAAEDQDGTRLRAIAVDSPALDDAGPMLRERFDPAWASDGARVVLASSRVLARALLAAPGADADAPLVPASDRLRLRAEPLHAAMQVHFETLVEMRMDELRIERAQAERELRGLMVLLEGLEGARLELAHGEDETVLSLTVRGR